MKRLLLISLFIALPVLAQTPTKKIPLSQRGAANGVATLDGSTTVPVAQIPALPFTKITKSVTNISGTSIDFSVAKIRSKTLAADTTFTFTGATTGDSIIVFITNTAGNFVVTWPTVKWPGGVAPTQTVGAHTDIYSFIYDGTSYWASYIQNY